MPRKLLAVLAIGALVALAIAASLVLAFRGDGSAASQVVVAPGRDSFALVSRAAGAPTASAEFDARDDQVHWVRTSAFPWFERDAFHRGLVRDAQPGATLQLGDATVRVPSADHLRIAFVGDTGSDADAQRVLAQVAAQHPDVVVHLGDVAYAYGDESKWDAWMDLAARELPGVPIAYATGNHDRDTGLDRAQMDGLRGGGSYYSFELGPVHVAVLDSNDITDAQARWLDDDLAHANARWLVAVEHAPWYSSGTTHGSDVAAQAAFGPILAKHGVKLAVAGHEHNYERTAPISGVTYVVTGGGGAGLYRDFKANPASWSLVRHEGHGFLLADFTTSGLRAKALDADGKSFDGFSL